MEADPHILWSNGDGRYFQVVSLVKDGESIFDDLTMVWKDSEPLVIYEDIETWDQYARTMDNFVSSFTAEN